MDRLRSYSSLRDSQLDTYEHPFLLLKDMLAGFLVLSFVQYQSGQKILDLCHYVYPRWHFLGSLSKLEKRRRDVGKGPLLFCLASTIPTTFETLGLGRSCV